MAVAAESKLKPMGKGGIMYDIVSRNNPVAACWTRRDKCTSGIGNDIMVCCAYDVVVIMSLISPPLTLIAIIAIGPLAIVVRSHWRHLFGEYGCCDNTIVTTLAESVSTQET